MPLHLPSLISRKRDGLTLDAQDIRDLIASYSAGHVPEEQMSALLMAIVFRGLDDAETTAWTQAMLHSGDVLDFSGLGRPVVDKHSTGGVGDKVSLILAPLAAACGLTVPMVSGRGLGHTGGTIDKLEAIPGFSCDLSPARFREVLAEVGCAIIGATGAIAPADRRLYALRDVTGTVASIPLIVASIMSKKLAEGLSALVLDVKVGHAAFMKTEAQARELARRMIATGEAMGVRTAAMLTRMEEPLGHAVGNACEVVESLEILSGSGPRELTELCLQQAAWMVHLGLGHPLSAARAEVERALSSGRARARFEAMVAAQGGDLSALPAPTQVIPLAAPRAGFVAAIDGLTLAETLVTLGAGRKQAGDAVDPRVGLLIQAPVGCAISAGAPLADLHLGERNANESQMSAILNAFTISDAPPAERPLILDTLTA